MKIFNHNNYNLLTILLIILFVNYTYFKYNRFMSYSRFKQLLCWTIMGAILVMCGVCILNIILT